MTVWTIPIAQRFRRYRPGRSMTKVVDLIWRLTRNLFSTWMRETSSTILDTYAD